MAINYIIEERSYVETKSFGFPQNSFNNIKKDSFNPHGAYSVESALGFGLITTVFDLLIK